MSYLYATSSRNRTEPSLMNLPRIITIKRSGDTLDFELKAGDVAVVAGANGTGKSALIYQIYRELPQGLSSYYPGHRQISFNGGWDNFGQDMEVMPKTFHANSDHFNRYKSSWAEDHFKSIVRKLQNAEARHNQQIVFRIRGDDKDAVKDAKRIDNPLGIMNSIFSASGLAVRLDVDEIGLRVNREDSIYRVDQMSDGERAALFIVGAVLTQQTDTVVLIDEPERHLHPSISGPLLEATIRSRPDLAFVIATHDISLIESVSADHTIHVTNSKIVSRSPERREYDAHLVEESDGLPEQVRVDLLGVRHRVLFTEGEKNSLDREIYSRIYPGRKIVPKGGWEKCVEAVRALRENPNFHWLDAVAIIDADGRDRAEAALLEGAGVYALQCATVENLLLIPQIILSVANVLHMSEGGDAAGVRFAKAEEVLTAIISAEADDIVSRRVMWRANRKLADQKISLQQIRGGIAEIPSIDVRELLIEEKNLLDKILKSDGVIDGLRIFPVKNTGIPAAAAKAIGTKSIKHYQAIVLRQIDLQTDEGILMLNALREVLPNLPN
jgi:ABC-type multidrug transport system ATPase subunit